MFRPQDVASHITYTAGISKRSCGDLELKAFTRWMHNEKRKHVKTSLRKSFDGTLRRGGETSSCSSDENFILIMFFKEKKRRCYDGQRTEKPWVLFFTLL